MTHRGGRNGFRVAVVSVISSILLMSIHRKGPYGVR
jgi:hypothetical protein